MTTDGSNDRSTPRGSDPVVSSELLESIQRLTGAGAWSYGPASDELRLSDQATEILRIDSDAAPDVGALVDCFVEPARSRAAESIEEALEATDPFEFDAELAVEGTTERHVRLCADPRTRGDGGVVVHGVVQDVTDAKRQEQRIEVLRRTSQELREAHSPRNVAEIMAETSKNILGYVNTTVRLIDTGEGLLRTVVATEECLERAGERPDYPVDEETPAARTFRTGEPELHSDHSATEDERDRGELRSGLYVPIGDHGVLSAGDVVVDAFDERDVEAADLLGQLGAKAITRIGWTKRSRAV